MSFADEAVGKKFGRLLVTSHYLIGKRRYANYICDCGKVSSTRLDGIKSTQVQSCGCYATEKRKGTRFSKLELLGQTFGRLEVIESTPKRTQSGNYLWVCKCICGTICEVPAGYLTRKKSCGCLRKEAHTGTRSHFYKHGRIGTVLESYDRYKKKCINRSIEFKLSECEFIEITSRACLYCGDTPSSDYRNVIRNTVDRVDSSLGYIVENCVPCCPQCNTMKNTYTQDDFINQAIKIANFQTQNKG